MRRGRPQGRGGGRGPNRGGGGRGRGGGGGRNHHHRQRRSPTQASESGNKRERIAIESGALVLIDQFMLANPQFIEKLETLVDAAPEEKDDVIEAFGGTVVDLEPGTYRIDRDPFKFSIVIHSDDDSPDIDELKAQEPEKIGNVFVDTRCLAMIDRELLDDSELLSKYQQLWFGGQDKACRDLLRDNGGAVRYGFNRHGDDLGVFSVPSSSVVCLWPEGSEALDDAGSSEEAVA